MRGVCAEPGLGLEVVIKSSEREGELHPEVGCGYTTAPALGFGLHPPTTTTG